MTTDLPSDAPQPVAPAPLSSVPTEPAMNAVAYESTATDATGVIARPDTSFRVKRYIVTALMIGMGLWFGYDGMVAWPRENATIVQLKKEQAEAQQSRDNARVGRVNTEIAKHKQHSDLDVRIQLVLFWSLVFALGPAFLIWSLRVSRGEYRMNDEVISIPGHPPIPVAAIRAMDSRQWDKKGIAYVSYELSGGKKGTFKLDDFIYQRKPTDQIYDRVRAHLTPAPVEVAVASGTDEDMTPERDD